MEINLNVEKYIKVRDRGKAYVCSIGGKKENLKNVGGKMKREGEKSTGK